MAVPTPQMSCVTVSIGHASATSGAGVPPAILLANADAALYRAKTMGRNRVEDGATAQSSETSGTVHCSVN